MPDCVLCDLPAAPGADMCVEHQTLFELASLIAEKVYGGSVVRLGDGVSISPGVKVSTGHGAPVRYNDVDEALLSLYSQGLWEPTKFKEEQNG